MRALLQRVNTARVEVHGREVGRIGRGLLVFLGIGRGDTPREVRILAEKVANLRLFENDHGKFDRSLLDMEGELLVVSQFTLYADCRKGRRPSFTETAPPEEAATCIELFIAEMSAKGIRVSSGQFGERMEVSLVNEGPVTVWLEVLPGGEDVGPARGITHAN